MRVAGWTTCLWPGLPLLWNKGRLSGLALAVGFTLLLNFSLVITFIWTGSVDPVIRVGAWAATLVYWVVALPRGWRALRPTEPEESLDDLFCRARDQYLRGNWLEAEILVDQLLKRDPRDVEARLLSATLLRRAGKLDAARLELARLERLTASRGWFHEIAKEKAALARSTLTDGPPLGAQNEIPDNPNPSEFNHPEKGDEPGHSDEPESDKSEKGERDNRQDETAEQIAAADKPPSEAARDAA